MNDDRICMPDINGKLFNSYEDAVAEIEAIKIGDPRSAGYVRQVVRPKINFLRIVLNILIPALITIAVYFILWLTPLNFFIVIFICFLLLTIYFLVRLKSIAICTIKIYQATASDARRLNCRFEPSCSVYAISAYKKYGFIKGTIKTLKRLKRCCPPNGGVDLLE